MEGLEAFKDKPAAEKEKSVPAKKVEFTPYSPKPVHEQYVIGGNTLISINHEDKVICIDSPCCDDGMKNSCMFFPFDDVPEIVQFLAWAMREKIKPKERATADGEENQQ